MLGSRVFTEKCLPGGLTTNDSMNRDWRCVPWWEQHTCPQWQPGPLLPLPFYLSGVYFQVRSQASCQWAQMASAGFRALLPTSKTLQSSQCWSPALSPPITGPASTSKFPLGVVGVGLWVLHTVCSQEDQTNTEETQGKREAASLLYLLAIPSTSLSPVYPTEVACCDFWYTSCSLFKIPIQESTLQQLVSQNTASLQP